MFTSSTGLVTVSVDGTQRSSRTSSLGLFGNLRTLCRSRWAARKVPSRCQRTVQNLMVRLLGQVGPRYEKKGHRPDSTDQHRVDTTRRTASWQSTSEGRSSHTAREGPEL